MCCCLKWFFFFFNLSCRLFGFQNGGYVACLQICHLYSRKLLLLFSFCVSVLLLTCFCVWLVFGSNLLETCLLFVWFVMGSRWNVHYKEMSLGFCLFYSLGDGIGWWLCSVVLSLYLWSWELKPIQWFTWIVDMWCYFNYMILLAYVGWCK